MFPKYFMYQNVKIDSEIKILKVRKVRKTNIKIMQFKRKRDINTLNRHDVCYVTLFPLFMHTYL